MIRAQVGRFDIFLCSNAKPNTNGRSDKRMSIIWNGWMCDEPLVIRVVLVSCCAAYGWCSIISAQGTENGCQDCVIEFGFQLFWSGLRRGVAMSGSVSCFRIFLHQMFSSQVQESRLRILISFAKGASKKVRNVKVCCLRGA